MPTGTTAAADISAGKKTVTMRSLINDPTAAGLAGAMATAASAVALPKPPATTVPDSWFDGLRLDAGASARLARCIEAHDTQGADIIVRAEFNLLPSPLPPSHFLSLPLTTALTHVYDPDGEDATARDHIRANALHDAYAHAAGLGFTTWQIAVWVTLFAEAHERCFAHPAAQSLSTGTIEDSMDLFIELLASFNYHSSRPRAFSRQESMYLIDYWTQAYLTHRKLASYVFSKRQDVAWTHVRLPLNEPSCLVIAGEDGKATIPMRPLADAIPAERWDEYCRSEEERIRAEKAKVEEEAQMRAKNIADAEAAAAAAAAVLVKASDERKSTPELLWYYTCRALANMLLFASTAREHLIEIHALDLPPPPGPVPESLFPPSSITGNLVSSEPAPTAQASDPERDGVPKTLNPYQIAQILTSTIDTHIALLETHLDKIIDFQALEIQRVLDVGKGKKEESGKAGKAVATAAALEGKGGGGDEAASSRKKSARPQKSAKTKA
ncbi:hypothetical protein HKX48_001915 [Thoreauomyces humboldtii]|nr:hypothetical protein HKX48_001915 [Thoreauomyces humboldtii]